MLTFASSDLARRLADVQRAATKAPVVVTYHEKPRFVMMTIEEFARRPGVSVVVPPEALPESAVVRLQAIADEHPDTECTVAGGLAELLETEAGSGGFRP